MADLINYGKEFMQKNHDDIICDHSIFIKRYRMILSEETEFYDFNNKETKDLLNHIFDMFSEYFWKGEHMKSLEYNMLPPVLLSKNESHYYGCPVIGFDNPRPSVVFAIHNITEEIFIWDSPILKIISEKFYKNAKFVKNNVLNNVDEENGVNLAVWFRTAFYDSAIKYFNESADVKMFNNNLVVFKLENEKGEIFKLYSLIDLDIKDPDYEEISDKLGLFHVVYDLFFREKKTRKAHPAILAFGGLCKHISEKLQIPNGVPVKKIAGIVNKDMKEKEPGLEVFENSEKAKRLFEENIEKYKALMT